MRYAVISDIHANLEALTAVLEKIDENKVDKIICLGDLVGYNANPNECLKIMRERKIKCIAGNHDTVATGSKKPARFGQRGRNAIYWTRRQLTSDNIAFLKGLPLVEIIDNRFLIVHGSLHPKPNEDNYLLLETELMKSFDVLIKDYPEVNVCFFGHTHLCGTYEYDGGILSMTKHYNIKLKPNVYYFLNPGSVGKSHNHKDSRASFLIFDSDSDRVEFQRVEYDYDKCKQKAEGNNLLDDEGRKRLLKYIGVGKRVVKRVLYRI